VLATFCMISRARGLDLCVNSKFFIRFWRSQELTCSLHLEADEIMDFSIIVNSLFLSLSSVLANEDFEDVLVHEKSEIIFLR
jgi:hypothetical protein